MGRKRKQPAKQAEPKKVNTAKASEVEQSGSGAGRGSSYRILVAVGPFSGKEGKITLTKAEAQDYVELGWIEPVKAS